MIWGGEGAGSRDLGLGFGVARCSGEWEVQGWLVSAEPVLGGVFLFYFRAVCGLTDKNEQGSFEILVVLFLEGTVFCVKWYSILCYSLLCEQLFFLLY